MKGECGRVGRNILALTKTSINILFKFESYYHDGVRKETVFENFFLQKNYYYQVSLHKNKSKKIQFKKLDFFLKNHNFNNMTVILIKVTWYKIFKRSKFNW